MGVVNAFFGSQYPILVARMGEFHIRILALSEGWQWILKSYLGWEFVDHYLDDAILVIKAIDASLPALASVSNDYERLLYIMGCLPNRDKDEQGTCVKLLGLLVNTANFTVSVPDEKRVRILQLTTEALRRGTMSLKEARSLTGLLSFCAPPVQLGFAFCRCFWSFIASFQPQWPLLSVGAFPRILLKTLNGGMDYSLRIVAFRILILRNSLLFISFLTPVNWVLAPSSCMRSSPGTVNCRFTFIPFLATNQQLLYTFT